MGYEVLDAGADDPPAGRRLPGLSGSVEVHDLSDLPHPRAGRPSRARPTRATVVLVAATLLGSAAAGAYWTGHRPAERQVSAASGPRVLAVGQPATLAMVGTATAASVRISLVNVGRVPVRVVTSPSKARPALGATMVAAWNAVPARIAPGEAQQVVAAIGISCASSTWVTPSLTVRGPDGRQQRVIVRDANLDTYRVNARALCRTPGLSLLTATLVGTDRAPQLLVHNGSDHTVTVMVDPHSPVPQAPDLTGRAPFAPAQDLVKPPVELSTVPKLPVLLTPAADTTVTLQLHLHGCLPLVALSTQAYLQLLAVPMAAPDEALDTDSTTVDLTALLSSARAGVCD